MSSPADVEVGQKKFTMQLLCPAGFGGAAFLSAVLPNGKPLSVEFKPHEVKVLLALNAARAEDAAVVPPAAQGWRLRARIADAIAAKTRYPVDKATISAYAVNLLKRLSAAVNAALPGENVPLIERRPKLGYRLAQGVEIQVIDGGGESESEQRLIGPQRPR